MRLAGADAGTINVIGRDGACYEPVVDRRRVAQSHGVLQSWCAACAESRNADSECVRSDLCGHDDRIPADVLGPVCKHVVAVPLRHRDRPVGTLNLMFDAECALPPEMTPLLRATGDLLGMTLDNARLARENLRIRLTSERQMMANEVHDSLAQGLTYMRMRMSLLRDAIRADDELRALKYCERRRRRARQLAAPAARADHLLPQPDGSAGPAARAAARSATSFFDRTGIALEFDNRSPTCACRAEREIEVFHIVQEALANVCRHASASARAAHAGPQRRRLPSRRRGRRRRHRRRPAPAARATTRGHYGIAIMRERARRLGGDIALERAGGTGTRVALAFPAAARRGRGIAMTEPIRVVLIDDHGLCRRGLSELLEARAGIKVVGDHRRRRRGGAPAARRAARPRDHGPAHGAGRRPPPAHAPARRRHRHAGRRADDERFAGRPRRGRSAPACAATC